MQTDDKITVESAEAIQKYSVGIKVRFPFPPLSRFVTYPTTVCDHHAGRSARRGIQPQADVALAQWYCAWQALIGSRFCLTRL